VYVTPNASSKRNPVVDRAGLNRAYLYLCQPCKSLAALAFFVGRPGDLLQRGKAVKAVLLAIGLLLLSWVLLAICEALPALPAYQHLFMGGR